LKKFYVKNGDKDPENLIDKTDNDSGDEMLDEQEDDEENIN